MLYRRYSSFITQLILKSDVPYIHASLFLVLDNHRDYRGVRVIVPTFLLYRQLKLLVVLHHVVRLYLVQIDLKIEQFRTIEIGNTRRDFGRVFPISLQVSSSVHKISTFPYRSLIIIKRFRQRLYHLVPQGTTFAFFDLLGALEMPTSQMHMEVW